MIEQTERERDIEEQVASDVTGDGKLTDAPQESSKLVVVKAADVISDQENIESAQTSTKQEENSSTSTQQTTVQAATDSPNETIKVGEAENSTNSHQTADTKLPTSNDAINDVAGETKMTQENVTVEILKELDNNTEIENNNSEENMTKNSGTPDTQLKHDERKQEEAMENKSKTSEENMKEIVNPDTGLQRDEEKKQEASVENNDILEDSITTTIDEDQKSEGLAHSKETELQSDSQKQQNQSDNAGEKETKTVDESNYDKQKEGNMNSFSINSTEQNQEELNIETPHTITEGKGLSHNGNDDENQNMVDMDTKKLEREMSISLSSDEEDVDMLLTTDTTVAQPNQGAQNVEALAYESNYLTRKIQEGNETTRRLEQTLKEKDQQLETAGRKIKDLQIRLIRSARDDEAKDRYVASLETELKDINKRLEEMIDEHQKQHQQQQQQQQYSQQKLPPSQSNSTKQNSIKDSKTCTIL